MKPVTRYHVITWIMTLLIPVILVLTGVRLLMMNSFLVIEYHLPGFPNDPYGFSKEDRIYWSKIARDYLLNQEDISFLEDLRFETGEFVYNQRELRHMVDVKNVVKGALTVWYISLGLFIVCGVFAWLWKLLPGFHQGLSRGGLLTLVLLGAIIIFVLVGFNVFFVAFHNVFFEEGTWVFYYSDTLIRLFPERFWRDAFMFVAIFAVVIGISLGYLFNKKSANSL